MSNYTGVDRRRGPELDTHFEVTQQNVRDIGEMRSDIAGLKVGQDALGAQTSAGFASTSEKFEHLSRQLSEISKPKPPIAVIPLFTLAMVVLGGFGTVMVFLSNQTAMAMQREADMRIEHISERFALAEEKDDARHMATSAGGNMAYQQQQDAFLTFVANVQQKFADDDIREQKDAYDKGFAAAKFNDLSAQFHNLENQLTEQHRIDVEWRLGVVDRLSKNETGLRASGQYMQEHVHKQGSQGHPVPERQITTDVRLAD